MILFQENTQRDGKTEGRTDPISQDSSSYRQVSDKYNCSRLVFQNAKDIEHNIGLTKNHCITIIMQKINSVHILVLNISRCEGFEVLSIFDHAYSNNKITFSFRKSNLESCDQIGHTKTSFINLLIYITTKKNKAI